MQQLGIDEIGELIQQGRAAALAGDSFQARNSFRRATELDPNNPDAWVGLSSVVPILAEKRDYLQRALQIDPGHQEAQASLAYVEKLIGEGMQIAPSQRRAEQIASSNASPLLSTPEPATVSAVTHCYIHPDRETGLHCTSCNRPICGQCAKSASVGQLCPECRRARRPPNYQVGVVQIATGGLTSFLVTGLVSYLVLFVAGGFFFIFLLLFLAPLYAEGLLRLIDRVTRNKRGREMQIAVGAGMVCATLPWLLLSQSLGLLLFAILATITIVRRLK